jgi:hypothetical protein
MKSINKTILFFAFLSFQAFGATHSKQEHGYEVNYIALSTMVLTPEVAKNYNIGRSKSKAFVNIAVLKTNTNAVSTPVEATIVLTAKNTYGQNKSVSLEKISENDGAIYYIGTFSVTSKETITFKAQVQPVNTTHLIEVKFTKEFHTD